MQFIKAKKTKTNLSHDYHWFICSQKDVTVRLSDLNTMSGPYEGLSIVMPMYTSCTVVIHVAYAELWNLSAVNGIDVIYVAFANC
jgi:hypothetical protein